MESLQTIPEQIQLYARLRDLTPTEGHSVPSQVSRADMLYPEDFGKWHFKDYLEDIRINGIRDSLKIHWNGLVGDGNFRYWGLRALGAEWAPIDVRFYTGVWMTEDSLVPEINIRQQFYAQAMEPFLKKYQVMPSRPELPVFPTTTRELIHRCERKPCWVIPDRWKFRLVLR